MTNDLELRIATDDDFIALTKLIPTAFLNDLEDDELDLHRMVFEPERTHIVLDSGTPVGTGGVLTRDLTVPGTVTPAAHVTGVAVAATHRRRGLLTSIMDAQLRSIRERGTEPLAVLWASEGAIYGRFGYGLASWHVEYDVPTRETEVSGPVPAGARLRHAVPGEVVAELAEVFDRVRAQRPGLSGRPGRWWEHLTADPKSGRRGMSAERAVLYEEDAQVRGYVRYRTKGGWTNTGPSGEVRVTEVVAETPQAYAALWRFLLSIDLVRKVSYSFAATDDPLPYLVTKPEGLGASSGPGLWVRIVDVPGALAARRYAVPVDVVLEVADSTFAGNAGRWHLVGDSSSAKCEPTDDEPDLTLNVRELGAAYLGGVSLTSLAAGGLVGERTPDAVLAVSASFGWRRAPWATEIF